MKYPHALIAMHLSALLWGLTGVLGAMTSVNPSVITVGRSIFALLAVTLWYGTGSIRAAFLISPKLFARVLLGGFLMGLHWFFFFLSIAKGGVAIALVTYAASAGLLVVYEMSLGWAKPSVTKIIAPILSLAGIYVIAPFADLHAALHSEGLVYGVISCLFISLMGLNGKSLLTNHGVPHLAITVGQLTGAIVIGAPLAFIYFPAVFTVKDLAILVVLGAFCSAVGQTLFNKALQFVPVGTAAVVANMEAPYGVALAALIVDQPITQRVAIGVALVTASSLLAGWSPQKERAKEAGPTGPKRHQTHNQP